jgi:hypothetical protein
MRHEFFVQIPSCCVQLLVDQHFQPLFSLQSLVNPNLFLVRGWWVALSTVNSQWEKTQPPSAAKDRELHSWLIFLFAILLFWGRTGIVRKKGVPMLRCLVIVALFSSVAYGQKFNGIGQRPGELRAGGTFSSIPEWEAKLKELRSKENRSAITNTIWNITQRKDLSAKEKTLLRGFASSIADATDSPADKIFVCNLLTRIGDKTNAAIVNKWLEDQDAGVRSGAVRAAHVCHDSETVTALAKYIEENGGSSRGIVNGSPIDALVSIGTKEARDVLQAIYKDDKSPNQNAAAKALDTLDQRKNRP